MIAGPGTLVQHRVPGRGRRAGRDVAADDVREIRRDDRLSERRLPPVAAAEGELSAEEQTVLRGTAAVLQAGPYTGGGAALQEVPRTRGPDEAREDDPRYRVSAVLRLLGPAATGNHQIRCGKDIRGRGRRRDEEHRGDR